MVHADQNSVLLLLTIKKMQQLIEQQQQAQQQGDYRLVWVCQQKIDRMKRERVGKFYKYFFP